jgi:hypothetical protein
MSRSLRLQSNSTCSSTAKNQNTMEEPLLSALERNLIRSNLGAPGAIRPRGRRYVSVRNPPPPVCVHCDDRGLRRCQDCFLQNENATVSTHRCTRCRGSGHDPVLYGGEQVPCALCEGTRTDGEFCSQCLGTY